jgi:hypothetical protein
MSPERIAEILSRMSSMPGTAVIPIAVVAAHDNVSSKTVRRTYPLVPISPRRQGVRLDYLRSRRRTAGRLTAAPSESLNPA